MRTLFTINSLSHDNEGIQCCHVMSCHVMLCHVMSCHVMSCYVMLCFVLLCYSLIKGVESNLDEDFFKI